MIEARNISKWFDGQRILFDINATFESGKTNLIIGKSGSGKTVFMKCLIGLFTPEQGEILYDGRPLSRMDDKQRRQLRTELGMLFQGSALFDNETVLGNVMFPMRFFTDWSESKMRERARTCLDRVNVKDSDNKYPNELSGGMQKRVGIARAIALNPSFLFCDEPNSGLDPYTSILIDRLISDITREFNMTTVVNTHDMNSILEIGDKIAFLNSGSLIWQGDKHSILETDCEPLKNFICANRLARNIIEGNKK